MFGDCLTGRHILPAQNSDHDFLLNTLEAEYSVHAFMCGLSTTVLCHIAAVKCAIGCPKAILDAGLVVDLKLQSRSSDTHLTSVPLSVLCEDSRFYKGSSLCK
jgi:hypothetical protein